MATYRQAEREDVDLLAGVLAKYHPRLAECGVTVGLLMAHAPRDDATGKLKGPALRHRGLPAAAVVKINGLQDRVEGKPDATIRVDGDAWPDMPRARRVALLDHELMHLEVTDETDDASRPKLRMREHDWTVTGFRDVVERHGEAAIDTEQVADLQRVWKQLQLPWG